MSYQPPYVITPVIIDLISRISESLGRLSAQHDMADLRLRRINRIKTIQGSLAIEGNTLSEDQVETILQGKTVVAPVKEVQEVRNAVKAYEAYPEMDPTSPKDLLKTHELLTSGLINSAGMFRSKGAAVQGKDSIIHVAPPASHVPGLMKDLLNWLDRTEAHPLIVSSVFHYEFEFIHPFEDGNGRVGRLWQTLILSRWNSLFHTIPVESMIYRKQQEYYRAINESSSGGESTVFIEFMLNTILEEIVDLTNAPVNAPLNAPVSIGVMKTPLAIMALVKENREITRADMASRTGKDIRTIARAIKRLQEEGKLKRVGSNKSGYWEIAGQT
jgi:Fic family protein